jgi:hypothetical protein
MNEPTPQPPTKQPPQVPLPTSGLAIASLVTGILGFMGPVVFSVIALFTGYEARKETRSDPPRASGDGFATAGIVMGYIQLGLACAGLCCLAVFAVWFLVVLGGQGQ